MNFKQEVFALICSFDFDEPGVRRELETLTLLEIQELYEHASFLARVVRRYYVEKKDQKSNGQ